MGQNQVKHSCVCCQLFHAILILTIPRHSRLARPLFDDFQLKFGFDSYVQARPSDSIYPASCALDIAKYIEKRGEGIHHIAYDVADIHAERARLIAEGFQPIGEIKVGADNKWVCFFHPQSSNGMLVELCQERSE